MHSPRHPHLMLPVLIPGLHVLVGFPEYGARFLQILNAIQPISRVIVHVVQIGLDQAFQRISRGTDAQCNRTRIPAYLRPHRPKDPPTLRRSCSSHLRSSRARHRNKPGRRSSRPVQQLPVARSGVSAGRSCSHFRWYRDRSRRSISTLQPEHPDNEPFPPGEFLALIVRCFLIFPQRQAAVVAGAALFGNVEISRACNRSALAALRPACLRSVWFV